MIYIKVMKKETAPITKKQLFIYAKSSSRGWLPITKNINVTDEHGNKYEATYPKRAKGLVKNGRARFVDENTICLACPPKINSEEIKMSENKTNEITETAESADIKTNYTIDYCLKQIEEIRKQSETLNETISNTCNAIVADKDENELAQLNEIVDSVRGMICYRDTTNQKLIAFYQKIYDDLKPISKNAYLDWISECVSACKPGGSLPNFEKIYKTVNSEKSSEEKEVFLNHLTAMAEDLTPMERKETIIELAKIFS